jgi:hypothetical protein
LPVRCLVSTALSHETEVHTSTDKAVLSFIAMHLCRYNQAPSLRTINTQTLHLIQYPLDLPIQRPIGIIIPDIIGEISLYTAQLLVAASKDGSR